MSVLTITKWILHLQNKLPEKNTPIPISDKVLNRSNDRTPQKMCNLVIKNKEMKREL